MLLNTACAVSKLSSVRVLEQIIVTEYKSVTLLLLEDRHPHLCALLSVRTQLRTQLRTLRDLVRTPQLKLTL
jgi:hypothetical protein